MNGLKTLADPGGIGTAVLSRTLSASAAVRLSFFWAMSATSPATCGVASDVPLTKKKADYPLLSWKGPSTHDPGAATSRSCPASWRLEKSSMKKSEPTVGSGTSQKNQKSSASEPPQVHWLFHPAAAAEMTGAYAPGNDMPAAPSLPAAATRITPFRIARSMAACSTGSGPGPPRLRLMTTGELWSGPPVPLRPAMYAIPCATTKDDPKPF